MDQVVVPAVGVVLAVALFAALQLACRRPKGERGRVFRGDRFYASSVLAFGLWFIALGLHILAGGQIAAWIRISLAATIAFTFWWTSYLLRFRVTLRDDGFHVRGYFREWSIPADDLARFEGSWFQGSWIPELTYRAGTAERKLFQYQVTPWREFTREILRRWPRLGPVIEPKRESQNSWLAPDDHPVGYWIACTAVNLACAAAVVYGSLRIAGVVWPIR